MAKSSATAGFGTEPKSLLASMTWGWTNGAWMTFDRGLTFCRKVCHSMKACMGGGWRSRRFTASRIEEKSSVLGSRRKLMSVSAEPSSSLEDFAGLGTWN